MFNARTVLRLTGSLLLLLVMSLGFAQSDNAKVPPADGCTFEGGRTTCEEVETGTSTYRQGITYATNSCGYNGDGEEYLLHWRVFEKVTPVTTSTTIFRGNSHIVESEDVQTSQTIEIVGAVYMGCY